jgi:hypothetical protein
MWGSILPWFVVLLHILCALAGRANDDEEEGQEKWYDDAVPQDSSTYCQLSACFQVYCDGQHVEGQSASSVAGVHTSMYESPDKSHKIYRNLWYDSRRIILIVATRCLHKHACVCAILK